MKKKLNVGGQAVMEGVMMRSPKYYGVAVRNEKGKIVVKAEKLDRKHNFFKMPFIRGVVNLIDMLVLGIKTLIWSADQQTDEKEEKLSKTEVFWTLFISLGFALLLFVALPYFLTHLAGFVEETRPILFNFIDGLIKIGLFLAYLFLISLMKDVRTLFEYHGAEHNVVHCYEDGKKLTVENARKYSTKHPRCGTSFIFIVFIFSMLIFSVLPIFVLYLKPDFNDLSFLIRRAILFPLRIAVIPLIAGVSYELLKLSAKFKKNLFVKLITLPGLWLQKITTKKPSKKQLEVAIISLKAVLKKEKA
jgi:uncharacterized protein YqhQ